jgi:general secretion pathway protein C
MLTAPPSRWTVQGLTFLLWGLAAASAAYWGLKLSAPAVQGPPVAAAGRSAVAPDPAAISRLLGATAVAAAAPAPTLASRFALVGVVADRSGTGVALISVDGKPAKPFRVGTAIEDNLVLQSVQGRRAVLGTGGQAALTLELPPLRR